MYTNPDNKDEIVDQLKNCPTVKDVIELIENTFPNWLITSAENYSNDYPSLIRSWELMCDKNKVKPARIMIVDFISMEKEYSLLNNFCDFFIKTGCVVRSKEQLIPCTKCDLCLASEGYYNSLKKEKTPVPDEWSDTCSGCN